MRNVPECDVTSHDEWANGNELLCYRRSSSSSISLFLLEAHMWRAPE